MPPLAPEKDPVTVPKPHVPTARQHRAASGLFDPKHLVAAFPEALRKLHPRVMVKNPVMFVVEVGSALTTLSALLSPSVFAWLISAWLWLTVVFANLAEAVAEGRGQGAGRFAAQGPHRHHRPSAGALAGRGAEPP
ncbi:hypothetical protein GCM10020229_39060 [Kitasatospora albolonga]